MILTPSCALKARLRQLSTLCLSVLLLGGCAYNSAGTLGSGTGIDNPVERKFTWFSYLDAADIRNSCAAGGPDQYRIVYNGQYYDHVRTYEVTSSQIVARARGASGDLTEMSFGSFEELLGPWNFQRAQAALGPAEWSKLRDLLHQSGFAAGDQAGLRLHSQEFYWLVAGCESGKFHFNAWADNPRALNLTRTDFLDFLLKHDGTGVGYRPPHSVSYREKNEHSTGRDHGYGGTFVITVHNDGINRAGI